MKKIILSTTIASAALIFAACSKSDNPSPANPGTVLNGNVMMRLQSSWGTSNFDLGNTYTLESSINGVPDRNIVFTTANMYISQVTFDNTVDDSYLLVSPAESMYDIGSVPTGSYVNLSFNVGLDSTTNHSDPTTAQAPLNETGMHWNWNTAAGYKFLKLEGQIDTSATGTSGEWKNFVYHVATDPMLRNMTYVQENIVSFGETTTPYYQIMWNKLFDGLDVATNSSNHGGGPTNTTIVNNLQSVFVQ